MGISSTNRITWKGVSLGDHAFITVSYNSNVDIRIIPRAKGVKLWSTEELGGGYFSITVSGVVASAYRFLLEKYFVNADSTFDLNSPGDIVIEDASPLITISDCYLESFNQSEEDLKSNTFTFKFIKSL